MVALSVLKTDCRKVGFNSYSFRLESNTAWGRSRLESGLYSYGYVVRFHCSP